MKKLALLAALLINTGVYADAPKAAKKNYTNRGPASVHWQPVSFEKIALDKKVDEAVVFTKLSDGENIIYSASYIFDGATLKTRGLPTDMYQKFIKDFRFDVLSYSGKNQRVCSNEIKMFEGTFASGHDSIASVSEKPTVKNFKETKICLNSGRYAKATANSFHRWYRDARAIFGL